MARRKPGLEGSARVFVLGAIVAAGLSACASTPEPLAGVGVGRPRAYNRPYEVNGRWYRPAAQPDYDAVGTASWYSYETHNRTTADGEVFDARLPTAAHTTLPIPSYLEVTNLANGRRVRVRLNDRGPFVAGRIIDLSRAAAAELGFLGQGTARVRVRYLGPAPLRAGEAIATARVSASSPEGDE
jgi:rare lipoprotein A